MEDPNPFETPVEGPVEEAVYLELPVPDKDEIDSVRVDPAEAGEKATNPG